MMSEKAVVEATVDGARKILDVATELFARRGFESVSMSDIAASAACSKANVYHHFKNKQQLFLGVISNACAGHTQFVEALLTAPGSGAEKLRRLIDFELRTMFENESRTWLLHRESSDVGLESVRHLSHQVFQQHFSAVVMFFKWAQDSGEFRRDLNPAAAAVALHGSLDIAFRCHDLLRGFPDDLQIRSCQEYGAQISSILLSGVSASPGSTQTSVGQTL